MIESAEGTKDSRKRVSVQGFLKEYGSFATVVCACVVRAYVAQIPN